jgi:hypothetical protein
VYVVINASSLKIVTAMPISKENDAKKMFLKKTNSETFNSDAELNDYFWRLFMDKNIPL